MKEPNFVRAEAASFKLLEKYSIEEANFPIARLAAAEGIKLEVGGLSGADAWLIRKQNGRGVIRLNERIASGRRRRFSIAHELGHWVMHPEVEQGYLCTAEDLSDYYRSPVEAEANWFAATLLMPKLKIAKAYRHADPNFKVIIRIADEFGTSLTAAGRRLIEVSSQPIWLIESVDGKISWWQRSQAANYLFLRKGSDIPFESLTREALTKNQHEAGPEQVSPVSWFPESDLSERTEFFETVRVASDGSKTLTLLWLPQ